MELPVWSELKVWNDKDEPSVTISNTLSKSSNLAMAYYVLELQMKELKAKVDPVELEEVYKAYSKK